MGCSAGGVSRKARRERFIAEKTAAIVQKLLRAAEIFAQRDPYPEQTRQRWSVWWTSVPEADDLFREAVRDLVELNPTQLSDSDTASTLTYRTYPALASLAVGESGVDRAALELALQQLTLRLAGTQSARPLQFVVENLIVDGEVPKFFGVHLIAPTVDEVDRIYADPLIRKPHTRALGLANVDAPGDETTAFEWGVTQAERFLNLLRGCGSDLVFGNFHPVHIINRNPVVETTSYRTRTDTGFQTAARSEYGTRKRRIARVRADLLSFLSQAHIDRLVSATTGTTTAMLTAVVASLETLGEACKPNLDTTRILLASSALEMLVGARGSDDVTFRSQTAMVAERATFLAGGQSMSERQAFDKRVRTLYGKGSRVRHGARPEISIDDIIELASITRRVALALLESPELSSVEPLDEWVQRMRYTTEFSPAAT